MKVFVLGGTGFLGLHAVLELLRRGHEAAVLALDSPKDDLLPPSVELRLGDIGAVSDEEARGLMRGCDALVFAIGADDRCAPRKPAYDFFHRANVLSTERIFRLASEAGLKKGVVCGSYFAYFNRIWPHLRLADKHPYIRSRAAQAQAAISSGKAMQTIVLELPYIFGSVPGRKPLWTPLIRYVNSPFPLFYTKGGTTMVAVRQAAEAVCGALERDVESGCYPVGDLNLHWNDMLERFAALLGKKKKVRFVPNGFARATGLFLRGFFRMKGLEHGLDPFHFMDLQTAETFIRDEDLDRSRKALAFGSGGLQEAFADTVKASL